MTTALYLPASVRDRLRRAAETSGDTYTDILLDAIDDQEPRLGHLIVKEGRPDGSLFRGNRRRRQRATEDQVQVTVRPSRDDLAVIDSLVAKYDATSRSAFGAAVLDAYLP